MTNRVVSERAIERAEVCVKLCRRNRLFSVVNRCVSVDVYTQISFVSSEFGEANKRTRKYRGDPRNGDREKLCAPVRLIKLDVDLF